jgi:acyl-CoA carboxylase subunit beta
MSMLTSRLDRASATYRANRDANLALLRQLDEQLTLARAGGGEKYVARHRARGKLLARERIELLLDRDAPFLDRSVPARWRRHLCGCASVRRRGPGAAESVAARRP